jgi:hypothetical protein
MTVEPGKLRRETLTHMYARVLSEMCMNRYHWVGLPEEIDSRFLEMTLFSQGLAVFFWDDEFSRYFALRGAGFGTPNMYNNPTEFIVYGNTMVNKTMKADMCVPIWNNYLRTGDTDIVGVYARRLSEIDTTTEVDLIHMRVPVLLTADTNERKSVLDAYKQLAEGSPMIAEVSSATGLGTLQDKIGSISTGIDKDYLPHVMDAKVKTWNEALTLLGIMNVNTSKRERMVVEEASGSSGQVLAMRAVNLQARKYACEWINAKYGLDIDVTWNLDDSAGTTDMQALNPMTEMDPLASQKSTNSTDLGGPNE